MLNSMLKSHKNSESLIFTDESEFNLFGFDGWRFVWQRKGTELKSANIKTTINMGADALLYGIQWELVVLEI